ncbi:exo-alpha-sialidase [Actinomyces weissii]|uniref:exo-alpha-sialidase n=1 Tax=Actinomyces weissii TaxID=675090 RepID=A0A7T7M9U2_9ACTO|nr:exo-alpha-sialidase [Actinomyces weissii]QQM67566.1 exo-alpha-sialidase [Actinomyces weissii]
MRTEKSLWRSTTVGTFSALALAGAVLTVPATTATAVPTKDGLMDITITQVGGSPQGIYAVGDVLSYDITLTNLSDQARSFDLAETNLSGGVDRCKWRNVAPQQKKTDCTGLATHTVTQEDLDAGGFTPSISYTVKAVNYQGEALNTPEPVTGATTAVRSAVQVESVTVTPAKDTYQVGDVVTVVPRLRSLWDQAVNLEVTESSFGETNQCNWRNLQPGNGAVYNCNPITYTVSEQDAARGSWTPTMTVSAVLTADGSALQTLRYQGTPLPVASSFDPAQPGTAPGVDDSLPASLSEAQALVTTTRTDNYRIPAIAVATNGDLLASYDERPKDNGHFGGDSPNPNHIVQRRSKDNGRTWEDPTYIHQGVETGAKEGYSDPSYVVDYQTGKIFNFHVKSYDAGWPQPKAGTDASDRRIMHAEVSVSADNGYTWTHRNITAEVDQGINAVGRFAASGQGIQIKNGPHTGRLVQQFTVRRADHTFQAVSLFSDDHGDTWQVGTPVGAGMDENKVVELSDGSLLMNSRDSAGSGFRKVSHSTDGGRTWGEVRVDRNLPDSTNNGQVIRAYPNAAPTDPKAQVLLFSNAPGSGRTRGTISLSCDDGRSWVQRKVFNQAFTGYSTIAVQADGSIGLLSEDQGYGGIFYRNLSMAWVGNHCTQPNASAAAAASTVYPGTGTTVTVTVKNPTGTELTGLSVAAPASETVTVTAAGEVPTTVPAQGQAVLTFSVQAKGVGPAELVFPVVYEGGSTQVSVSLTATRGPDVRPEAVAADSEERVGETAPNGPASAAVDGDPNTFWHTQWKNASPGFDPVTGHWIDLKVKDSDVPADQTPHVVGLTYTARQGLNMGRAKEYKIFTSADGRTWSEEPVASGTLADTDTLQRIELDTHARYVRFMALNSYSTGSNAKFLVAGEIGLTVAAPPAVEPEPTPSPSPSAPETSPAPETPAPEAPVVEPAFVAASRSVPGRTVLQGDWDGDGVRTFAVRMGSRVVFYNENRADAPVYASISMGRSTDQVLVGDWDGDGTDTLALRRGSAVYLQKSLTSTTTTKVVLGAGPVKVVHQDGKDVVVLAK